jgi:hypothetical protein
MSASLQTLAVLSYELVHDDPRGQCVTLDRVHGLHGDRWAIREYGCCLNKSGAWEREPQPSSRDDDFFARCRWDGAEEALSFWEAGGFRSRLAGESV